MTSSDDRRTTRDKILARRALYLSTALAAMGCSNSKSPQPPGAGSSDAQTTTSTGATASTGTASNATASGQDGAIAPEAPFEKVLAERPPLDVPEGLEASESVQLKGLRLSMDRKYTAIGKVWRQVPGCDPSAAACKPKWEAIEADAREMYRMFDRGIGGCPGVSGKTGSYMKRQLAHANYQQSLINRLEAYMSNVAKHHSFASESRVQRMLSRAKEPPPMPCLSPCMMPPVNDVLEVVAFTKGSAALRPDDASVKGPLQQVLAAQTSYGKRARLVIRGHADPNEPDADKLATDRAKAVYDWLVGQGLDKQQLRASGMGSQLLVARGDNDDTAANARVDFLVIKTP